MEYRKKSIKQRGGRVVFGVCLLFVLAVFFLSGCTGLSATDMTVETLEYRAEVRSDGSIDVVEKHNVNFSDRGKEYWNYFKSISLEYHKMSIPVEDGAFRMYVDGKEYPLYGSANLDSGNISALKTRLKGQSYYYLSASNVFEMGVVLPPFDEGNHVVEFRYTVTNVIQRMDDADALYLFLIPKNNEMNVLKMNGRISFPSSSAEKTFTWLHLDTGEGGVRLEADGQPVADPENYNGTYNSIYFKVENLPKKTSVETRLTLDNEIFGTNENLMRVDEDLESVKAQEKAWYDEFAEKNRLRKIGAGVDIGIAVFAVVIAIVFVVIVIVKRRPKKFEDAPEYVRDIPEDWSVEEASPVFWYYDKKNRTSEVISATILKLAKKYYLEIKVGEKKKQAEIRVKRTEKEELSPFEAIVLELLEAIVPAGEPFTMKEFEVWSKKNADFVARKIKNYEDLMQQKPKEFGAFRKNSSAKKASSIMAVVFGAIALIILGNGFFNLVFGITLTFAALGLIAAAFIVSTTSLIKIPLSDKGQKEYLRFKALEKYMCDFSNLKEHELPALILWEDYMVWATMMGVADKVAEQLEIAYPQYREMVMTGNNADAFLLLYLLSPRLRLSFGLNLAANVGNMMNTVRTVQNAQKISAMQNKFGGRGGGGGFGGGGFGGGGGGFGGGGGMGGR